ncbi:hypothetical protein Tco_1071391 [Tanacetum coccineum]
MLNRIFNKVDSTVIVNINESVHEIVPIIQQLVLNPEYLSTVKGAWLEGLINLEVDLCHQQVVPLLEMEEVKVEFGCHLEVRVEIEHEAH